MVIELLYMQHVYFASGKVGGGKRESNLCLSDTRHSPEYTEWNDLYVVESVNYILYSTRKCKLKSAIHISTCPTMSPATIPVSL